jgi:hypothetical protein
MILADFAYEECESQGANVEHFHWANSPLCPQTGFMDHEFGYPEMSHEPTSMGFVGNNLVQHQTRSLMWSATTGQCRCKLKGPRLHQ